MEEPMKKRFTFASLSLLLVLALTACGPDAHATDSIKASGAISGREVNVAPENGGVVKEVLV